MKVQTRRRDLSDIATVVFLLVLNALAVSRANAQCTDQWLFGPDQGYRGIPGTVYAAIEWTKDDGAGPRQVLVAGGSFSIAGQVAANSLAYWDGEWRAFGSGTTGTVRAMCSYQGLLIAAGTFTQIGGTSVKNIAKWDGHSWSPLGLGIEGTALSLLVWNEKLYVAGTFSAAGGSPANNIASWDGSQWATLGGGLTITTIGVEVRALADFQGRLFATGNFNRADGIPVSSFASWNGTAWRAETSGVVNAQALHAYNGLLYAGGNTTGGVRAFNGTTWSNLGSGVSDLSGSAVVFGFGELEGRLVVAGYFTSAGNVAARSVATWDGSQWAPIGEGIGSFSEAPVRTVTKFGVNLVAAGAFNNGLPYVRSIALWNGTTWSPLGEGIHPSPGGGAQVNALCEWNGSLIIGGFFMTAGNVQAFNIAQKANGIWQPIGPGLPTGAVVTAGVQCLTSYGNLLVAGGYFNSGDGNVRSNVATWDGDHWTSLGNSTFGNARALTTYKGDLIAAGDLSNF